MKLSLSRLEEVRNDPASFSGGGGSGPISFSGSRALQYAAYTYHHSDNDLPATLAYLDRYESRFSSALMAALRDEITQYDSEFQARGDPVADWNIKVAIAIDDLEISGEVGRLDLVADGRYAVWLLARRVATWQTQLRMPLLQRGFAERMGVDPQMVDVGLYFFNPGVHEQVCYNADEIAAAVRETRELAAALR